MRENNIEKLLKSVTPRKTSDGFRRNLLEKIKEVSPTPKTEIPWASLFVRIAAAAAVVAACAMLWTTKRDDSKPVEIAENIPPVKNAENTANIPAPTVTAAKESEVYEPSSARTFLVGYEKEPVKINDESFNRYRYHLVDCMEWENKQSGERYRVTRPRKETIILCNNTY